jgi:hypothetical protein
MMAALCPPVTGRLNRIWSSGREVSFYKSKKTFMKEKMMNQKGEGHASSRNPKK